MVGSPRPVAPGEFFSTSCGMLHRWPVLPLRTALPLDSSDATPILAFHLLLPLHLLIPVPLLVLEDLSPLDSALGIIHYPHSLRDLSSSVALYPAVRDNSQPPLLSRSRPYFQSLLHVSIYPLSTLYPTWNPPPFLQKQADFALTSDSDFPGAGGRGVMGVMGIGRTKNTLSALRGSPSVWPIIATQ